MFEHDNKYIRCGIRMFVIVDLGGGGKEFGYVTGRTIKI